MNRRLPFFSALGFLAPRFFLALPFFLALRYSRSRSRSTFTRFISHFVAAGITLGVMALIVVTSVMNGFENELKTRILGVVPQVTITPAQQSSQRPQPLADWQALRQGLHPGESWPAAVQHVSPYVQSEGIIQGHAQMQAVLVQGIFPHLEPSQNILRERMLFGRLDSLRAGEYRVIIGRPLADMLDVQVGERVRVTAAAGQQQTPLGTMPAQRQFTVSGIFEVGADIDQQLVLLHGHDLARLLRYPEGQVTGLRLWLNDAFESAHVSQRLAPQFAEQGLVVADWQQRYGQLFAAVRMEKGMMMIMLGLIIVVAAFNAVSALIMLIQDKRSDIAILQTLGLSPQRIYLTLILQGMYSGVVGVLLGAVLGLLLSTYLNGILMALGIHVFSAGVALPVLIQGSQVVAIVLAALALTFIATMYPAWRAAQLQPAEILRYE